MKARGADFSSAQPLAEVEAVAGHLHFAFVKATQGTSYRNPLLVDQARALHAKGVLVGYYHFLQAGEDGARQWDYFRQCLAGLPSAPVALDYEMAGTTDAQARAFIRRGHADGYHVGLYGGENIIRRRLGHDWSWLAYWAAEPPPRSRWQVWQFTDGNGRQDYDVFNGSSAELRPWWVTMSRSRPARRVRRRWWFHDAHATRGPFFLAGLATRFPMYARRHPNVSVYAVERR